MADDQTEATIVLRDQALAEIAQQEGSVDSVRNRAVALLSVGTLVGGLFGSRLPHGGLSKVNLAGLSAALVFFVVSVVLVIAIAWPRDWSYGSDRANLVELVAEGERTQAQVNLSIADIAGRNWSNNQDTVRLLYFFFTALCAVTAAEVVGWALAVL